MADSHPMVLVLVLVWVAASALALALARAAAHGDRALTGPPPPEVPPPWIATVREAPARTHVPAPRSLSRR